MSFHSPAFLFALLPLTLLAYHACGQWAAGWGIAVLLGASLVFYAAGDPRHLPLLVASIAVNFALGQTMHRSARSSRRVVLLLGVAANVAMLALFKLRAQAIDPPGAGAAMAFAYMPLGVSFFTLQQVSYLVDRARDERGAPPPWSHYALYIAFFPHLVAGPIVRFRDVAPQYPRLARAGVRAEELAPALSLLVIGLAKKLLLADRLGVALDPLYVQASAGVIASARDAWVMGWGYLLQLYFDFSGYSDMAIGLALAFGLRVGVNFNSPLKAVSASDYVSRWHVSLATFVRDYVFSPLFRVLRRLPVASVPHRQFMAWAGATIVSFVTIGAWHSVSPTFLLAGVLIAFATVGFQLATLVRRRWAVASDARIGSHVIGRLGLLIGLTVFSVFFRSDRLATVRVIVRGMAGVGPWIQSSVVLSGTGAVTLLLASAIALAAPNTGQIFDLPGALPAPPRVRWRPSGTWSAAVALLAAVVITLLRRGAASQFIYRQF